uniref:Uncharacterized protein n=1 Tax=Anguilla anguilla TaxID=7936 RepID=A0A0E9PLJ2_ANGAN
MAQPSATRRWLHKVCGETLSQWNEGWSQ